MKKLLIILLPVFCYGQKDMVVISASINVQQISWFAIGKYHLLTTLNYHHTFKDDISVYSNIIRGSFDFIRSNKAAEYIKATNFVLERNRPIKNPTITEDSVIILNELQVFK